MARYVSIWFRHLVADWHIRRKPELRDTPFVLAASVHGRMAVTGVSRTAYAKGIYTGMVVADCRAVFPTLEVLAEKEGAAEKLLTALAEWCLRYTPVAAIDLPDSLILDASGCPHLWGGEQQYLEDITRKLTAFGYDVHVAMADTIGAAWAMARFVKGMPVIEPGRLLEALLPLPAMALRLDSGIIARLEKLGLGQVSNFISMPRSALRRRFGQSLLMRLDQALGQEFEVITPIRPAEPFQERLPCLDPIRTAKGIEVALQQLLESLCKALEKKEKGLRTCTFTCYRIDGNVQTISISTGRASRKVDHLFKLFEDKIKILHPDLGFELFLLKAPIVEDISAEQEALWNTENKKNDTKILELLDRVAGRMGAHTIRRYMPSEHYWPERSFTLAPSFEEQSTTAWRVDMPRPIQLLPVPEAIEVTVPLPDYPPMLFKYKCQLYNVSKADGPERIEQEWWLEQGLYRDYYCVEDEQGARYWLFRLGSYVSSEPKWFIHGFFA